MAESPKTNRLGMTKEDILRAASAQVDRLASAGMIVSVDPDVAEFMGAFEEDALSPEDARDSRFDGELVDEE